jgi:hypothetical protein
MKKLITFLGMFTGLSTAFVSIRVNASVDKSLLVGEWSEGGMCNNSRNVFTQDGQYLWLENRDGTWSPNFQGIFRIGEDNTVAVAENENTGGNALQIQSLTQSSLVGKWIDIYSGEGNSVTYIRCKNR